MNIEDLFEKHSVEYYDANEQRTEVLTKRRFEHAVDEIAKRLEIQENYNDMLKDELTQCREVNKKDVILIQSLKQQLEERNVSISAIEFCSNLEMKLKARDLEIVALKDALFMRNQMIQSLDKTIEKKLGREIALEKMLIEHQEFSQWLEEQMDNMTTEQVNNFLPNLYNKTFKLNHD